jgi:hypothetical protein
VTVERRILRWHRAARGLSSPGGPAARSATGRLRVSRTPPPAADDTAHPIGATTAAARAQGTGATEVPAPRPSVATGAAPHELARRPGGSL